MNILVTGAGGQLGSELKKIASKHSSWHFVFTDVNELDITNFEAVQQTVASQKIKYIINCAAYTAVDKAETDIDLATKLNIGAVKNLTQAAKQANCTLIHVSTDYVFDGTSCVPYQEEATTNPQSAYGRTKRDGELEALKYNKSIVIRTAWLYSTFGNNFVKTMLRLGAERQELKVVFDQIGSPTYAEDLANTILNIVRITEIEGVKPGVYHFSNEGVCSWFDFAWEILNFVQSPCVVKPIESKDYPVPAKRPSYSVFNKAKVKATYHIEIPYWKNSLYKCLNELTIK